MIDELMYAKSFFQKMLRLNGKVLGQTSGWDMDLLA